MKWAVWSFIKALGPICFVMFYFVGKLTGDGPKFARSQEKAKIANYSSHLRIAIYICPCRQLTSEHVQCHQSTISTGGYPETELLTPK
jgi:hypothetical protein